ncbi:GntR family transcriptional regulator [Microbacteriaceae bacterium VKM Ac-2854]|nr:GntR family transcriptional regulator [Microbacteriaceae bacterium VKM Ac-2854]
MTAETALHELLLDLDRSGPVPLYWQIAERLEAAITSGAIAAGARVENEVSLSARLGLSQVTVKKAMARLVTKGLVVRRRGFGTVVVPAGATRRLALTSLYDDLLHAGRVPGTVVLSRESIAADATLSARLAVPIGTEVLRVRRLRSADAIPIALLENVLVPRFASVTESELVSGGLYAAIRARGTHISVAHQVIGARTATARESTMLALEAREPLLTLQRTAFDAAGVPIEYGDHCYRTDAHSFDVTVVLP